MRLELPAQRRWVHTMTIPIRWGDMDAMGHVNNTVYFRYMESARLQWMGEWGMPANPRGEGPVIANAFCNFLRQLEYPGDVVVRSYVGAVGQRSFDMFHEMLRADGGDVVYANGGATVVWVDFPAQRSAPLPPALRLRLGGG
ncbi:MAG: acyl-CoA thioesterase [Tepidimonas ignava]|jgi:acyl-CoA thioester hydrolase|uniref:Acyl-CoA thioester hydrolase n=1 Tax=Tepidimonas ignava TaxID=114249 RepID=A0A4R3LFX0_9BURK|nr:acyl-CoA thioesterase [Tepidimonas ignava]TCS99071.1 acyl-CoA thioester hydrolase [Tepidimonas ignava]TSE22846.1 acyl-CoA thioester hydrolase, YbgC/YbaW family [Tepidimonas ignava]